MSFPRHGIPLASRQAAPGHRGREPDRVPRLDRYLLSQLLVHFGFFSLVLVGVYWINRAVQLFDQLMSDGQSAMVFVKFSLLTLPGVIRLVLPIAAFVASVYVTNKLIMESEIVVMQATGFSAFRMARPVLGFSLIVALFIAALVHVLVPLSRTTMVAERAALSENMTSGFLTDGQFTHPTAGVTFYMTGTDERGQLLGLFLEDVRSPTAKIVYTARSALFLRGASGPRLVMFDGMAQVFSPAGQSLSVTRFSEFTYDVGALLTRDLGQRRRMPERTTSELFWPSAEVLSETGATLQELRFEAHSRVAEPFLAVVVSLIGFACLLLGGFSRLGLWRQIGIAIAMLVVIRGLATVAGEAGKSMDQGWLLAYVAPVLGTGLAALLLAWSGRERRAARVAPA